MQHRSIPALALVLAATASARPAQVEAGDILVNVLSPGGLKHLRPDGTLVRSSSGAPGSTWQGASLSAAGHWVTTDRSPVPRVVFLEPGGGEVRSFACPEVHLPGDVVVFADGTVAVSDFGADDVDVYSPSGTHLLSITTPGMGMPFGLLAEAEVADDGTLCLVRNGGAPAPVGRFAQAGQIVRGPVGSVTIDLNALPLTPQRAVRAGETWNFQCWFRDLSSSNFTDAVSITFD
ncbi:MAG: hypothetical protein GY711_10185 [bacterium]|nr:hypothetical protein [bacterium]